MKLITLRNTIQNVAKKWDTQYDRHGWSDDKRAISASLHLLNLETSTKDDVAAMIGNRSWTNLTCNECHAEELDRIVSVGEPPDYGSPTASLCMDCARKALNLIETP